MESPCWANSAISGSFSASITGPRALAIRGREISRTQSKVSV